MGSKPSGNTTTTVQQNAPQFPDEAKPYVPSAYAFYGDILQNPPIYPGQRNAPLTPAEEAYLNQSYYSFGMPQPYQTGAENMLAKTQAGGYFGESPISSIMAGGNVNRSASGMPRGAQSRYGYGQFPQYSPLSTQQMEAYALSAAEPILERLNEETITGIRDSSQMYGGGATSVRSDIARQNALTAASEEISLSVIAPMLMQQQQLQQDWAKAIQALEQAKAEGDANRTTQASIAAGSIESQLAAVEADIFKTKTGAQVGLWEGERGRQMQGAQLVPGMMGAEVMRLEALKGGGAYERDFYQGVLDSMRQAWEEPLYRQDQAARTILGSQAGPGGGVTTQDIMGSSDGLGTATSIISTVAMVAGIAMKAFSSRAVKTDITKDFNADDIIDSLLNTEVKKWRYVFDAPGTERFGAILEEMPKHFHSDNMHLDIVSMLGAITLTLQKMEARLAKLENYSS
jgi:hypothetical protein